jgi:hypothetical protein
VYEVLMTALCSVSELQYHVLLLYSVFRCLWAYEHLFSVLLQTRQGTVNNLHTILFTSFNISSHHFFNLMLVIPLRLNISIDKYTDFPSNTAVHFIAAQLHASVHYRNIIRLSNKNF